MLYDIERQIYIYQIVVVDKYFWLTYLKKSTMCVRDEFTVNYFCF